MSQEIHDISLISIGACLNLGLVISMLISVAAFNPRLVDAIENTSHQARHDILNMKNDWKKPTISDI